MRRPRDALRRLLSTTFTVDLIFCRPRDELRERFGDLDFRRFRELIGERLPKNSTDGDLARLESLAESRGTRRRGDLESGRFLLGLERERERDLERLVDAFPSGFFSCGLLYHMLWGETAF